MPCSGLAIPSPFDSAVVFVKAPENSTVVGTTAVTRDDHSRVTARPLATRRMMNNCAMAWLKQKALASDTRVILGLTAYLHVSNRQETYSSDTVVVYSKGNYENDGADSVWHGGLDNHEDDGIIHAGVVLAHDLPQLASHGEQAIRDDNGINHSEPHFDAEVGKLDVDIIKHGTGARLYLDDDRQPYSRRQ
jgi:hypothetical protein